MNHKLQHQNLTLQFTLIQCCHWGSCAAILGFCSVYLLDYGFTNTQIGIIAAGAYIVSSLVSGVLAFYADSSARVSLKKIISVLNVIQVILSISLIIFKEYTHLIGFLFAACTVGIMVLNPLLNSLGMACMNQGKTLDFGVTRGIGSVTYGLVSYALGNFISKKGSFIVPVMMVVISIGYTVFVHIFPFEKETMEAEKKTVCCMGGFIKRYKRFFIVLTGCILLYVSHVCLNNFVFQIIRSKGGTSAEQGFAMSISACLEIPAMFLFSRMKRMVRTDIWFRVSGLFFLLKTLGTLYVSSVIGFYFVQIFQIGGYALLTVSSVYYINELMEEKDVIKGQTFFVMTYYIGSVLGSIMGGYLIDRHGVDMMLKTGTLFAAAGMVIVMLAAERSHDKPCPDTWAAKQEDKK